MSRKEIQKITQTNELVKGIHDALLDRNIGMSDAFNDACAWIAELHLQVKKIENSVSLGYIRENTSDIKWKSKLHTIPVDDGDAWISTGIGHDK